MGLSMFGAMTLIFDKIAALHLPCVYAPFCLERGHRSFALILLALSECGSHSQVTLQVELQEQFE